MKKIFLKNNCLDFFETDAKFKSARTWKGKEQRSDELIRQMELAGVEDDHTFVEIVTYGIVEEEDGTYGCEIWRMGS